MEFFETFEIYNTTSYATSCISIALNTLLVTLVLNNTKKEMKSYRHILLQSCLVDIWFAFVSAIFVPQLETDDFKIFFRISTPWFPQNGIFPCIGIWVYQWSLLTLLWSTIIQPFFQYFVVFRKITINGGKVWIFQFFILFLSMIISLPNICTPCMKLELFDYEVLKEMGLWKNFPQLHFTFRYAFYRQFWFIFYAFFMFFITFSTNFAYFILTWKVKRYLNISKTHFSPKTIKLYKQFEHKLFLKSIMPCFSILILTGIFLYIYVLPQEIANKQGGFLMAAFMPLNFIIVFNPIITVLSIKSYRDAVFCLRKKKLSTVVIIS